MTGCSISMKFAYQTQTKHYNDLNAHLVCVEHGFIINQSHTSIKKAVHKKIDLKDKYYSIKIVCRCLSFLVF